MKYVIEIEVDNDAFLPDPNPEVSRILRQLAKRLDAGADAECALRDVNGNRVGEAKIVRD